MPVDTIGNNDSWFAQQMRELMDPARLDPANDPTMQPVLDTLRREMGEDEAAMLAELSAAAEGSGRFGGDMYNYQQIRGREEADEALAGAMASQLFAARQAERERQMQGLNQVNARDLGAMQDATSRWNTAYSSDAQERAANASASASGRNAAMAAESARRGQDLAAIQALIGSDQFGIQSRMGIGNAWQGQQLGSLGQIPGLTSAGMAPLQGQMAANAGLGDIAMGLGQLDAQNYGSHMAGAGARASMSQWRDPLSQLGRYLGIIQGVGGMGNNQQGQMPGAPQYGNPAMAGLGGAMAGYGTFEGA
jgi:hypothetical protein